MEYTEEVKKEADSIVEKILNTSIHFPYKDTEDGFCVGTGYMVYKSAVYLAIQDMQSVLEELNNYASKVTTNGTIYEKYYENRLLNLTQQIEYLKSKI